jgi:hypothetical protein
MAVLTQANNLTGIASQSRGSESLITRCWNWAPRSAIDDGLEEGGWVIQSRDEMNFSTRVAIAVRESATASGPVDYALFVDKRFCDAVEAKAIGITLSGSQAIDLAFVEGSR